MSTTQTQADVVNIISYVTARAQADATFCASYVANPNQVLAAAGLQIPSGVKFHVIQGNTPNSSIPNSTATDVYLVVPSAPVLVRDESLASASKASCQSTASTCFTVPSCVSCVSSASTNSCH